ncbi:hypothetical protein LSH36_68g11024 [Paralvinella palmiformis]|uniref:Phosphatidic acid phosphatase type 2/haloperoxidase domain-containing protein n=1 Tax=Paralvinella palmiformis TaxID=53620 RepID=A0AAD9K4W2_9ANNE|nr:hypothetical protein LSH36_68g11024 [Paralvinella palmiformis]
MALRLRKTKLMMFAVDLSIVIVAGVALLLVHVLVKPFDRGFFCDDETIQHPYREDTVPMPLCAAIGVAVAVSSFFVIECSLSLGCKKTRDRRPIHVLWTIAKLMAIFCFGVGSTLILTETGKLCLGRLRPNFLTVCKPNISAINCTRFVEYFTCTNTELSEKIILDSRKSFPSGHSSFVAFTAIFLGVYYEKRLKLEFSVFLKTFLQIILAVLALFTMFSRVSDYKHHWSDVLGGAFLGVATGVWTVCCLGCHIGLRAMSSAHQTHMSPVLDTQHLPLSDPCTPEPATFLSPNFDKIDV